MNQSYKTKIAHLLDNGDKLELEAHLEAESHDAAFDAARARFQQVIAALADAGSISIDKTKIEMTESQPAAAGV